MKEMSYDYANIQFITNVYDDVKVLHFMKFSHIML